MSERSFPGRQALVLASLFALMPVSLAVAQNRVLYQPSPLLTPQQIPFPVNKNQYVAPNTTARQASYNMATLGKGLSHIPPYAMGYNPYVHTINAPRVGGGFQPFGGYGGMGWGGVNLPYAGQGYANSLQGIASVTAATGQYWQDIQQARITREQSRQMSIDTQMKRIKAEIEYEAMKPKADDLARYRLRTDLEMARLDPQRTEIWSGRTLNILLKSVMTSSAPLSGPTIDLEPNAIRGLNLRDPSTRGNLSMAKDDGKIDWTETLGDTPFDSVRDPFMKTFTTAMRGVQAGSPPSRTVIKTLRGELSRLNEKLDDMVRDITPSEYTQSRRLLNQLKSTVDGMTNARLVRSSGADWKRSVRTIRDLVDYCMKNGLEFGPAIDGDEAAYTSTYYVMRTYERNVVQLASSSLRTP